MNRLEILTNIDNVGQLEKLYRGDKAAFKREFNLLYTELTDRKFAEFWNERLNYESPAISWGSSKELTFVIIASLIAGVVAKLPLLLNINPGFFYPRNFSFIIFPALTAYFTWKKNLSVKKILFTAIAFLISLVFINLLPANNKSDTLILSCIYLPVFLWAVLGFTFAGNNPGDYNYRIDFLKYNGDLVIMSGLLAIAGGMLTGITIGLFSVIGLDIKDFYFDYVAAFGGAAVPIVATYITQTNPLLVDKVSPVIAKIFSPLVLIMLVVYLTAILITGKNPYNDRDFLMIFNFLLIGVMAIIFFSVAATTRKSENPAGNFILFALSIVTVIVNCIALSAILFRISEWGITPNRIAVSGANILMLVNLLIVTHRLFKSVSKKGGTGEVENSISMFLPVYIVWAIIVTFIFPFLFHFK